MPSKKEPQNQKKIVLKNIASIIFQIEVFILSKIRDPKSIIGVFRQFCVDFVTIFPIFTHT